MGWIPPWKRRERVDDAQLIEAVKSADAVLFFGGLSHQYDLEGTDRRDMALHEGPERAHRADRGLESENSGGPCERLASGDAVGR